MVKKYRRRILRNALITGFLLFLIWWGEGYPLPTLEMDLHRWERQTLREESEIIWTYDWGEDGDWTVLAGLSGGSVNAARGRREHYSWPRNRDKATLIFLPADTLYVYDGSGIFVKSFLAVDPPVGAERARLTLEVALTEEELYQEAEGESLDRAIYRETYTAEGERQGEAFFFSITPHHYFSRIGRPGWEEDTEALAWEELESMALGRLTVVCSSRSEGLNRYPWHLEFFDSAGNLLEEQFSDAADPAAMK